MWALTTRSERILAIVDPEHRSSQRVLAKLGMRPIGRDYLLDRTWLVHQADRDH